MARVAESSGGFSDDGVRAGTVIAGRYRLERPIGTGGMSTIWEGTHLALNRPIAIKFIDLVGPNSAKLRDRFLREARVAAAIRHRNVVDIVDFGATDDGHPFMVMELLRGRTLAARLGDGLMSVGEAVRIVARLLSGLSAVHDAGIVHRDLKPENVFLVEDADGAYPKLLDFGVSRALDPTGDLESVLPTRENAIVGTPQYMSPEQARGLRELDQRSDLWSAGVMLYELLTGRLPFDAEAVGDVIIQIATEDPPDFALFRPDLAGPVERVVKKAMQRDPSARFESAREMRNALLAAVARTAAELPSAADRVRVDSHSDLPPIARQELLSAVGESYEPGDSGMLDFTDHDLELPEDRTPPSGETALPPPAPPIAADPFARSEALTLDGPARSPSRGAAWIAALSVALVVVGIGAGVTGWLMLDRDPIDATLPVEGPPLEEPVGPVRITFEGAPAGAQVRVDGRLVTDPAPALPRDGALHAIEVEAADGRVFRTEHRADRDGHYVVTFPAPAPVPTEPVVATPEPAVSRGPAARPRRVAPPAPAPVEVAPPPPVRPRARGATELLRDPGY